MSTSTESSACTRGFRRSSRAVMMSWEGGQGHDLAQDDQGVTISHPLDPKRCLTEGQQLSPDPNRQPYHHLGAGLFLGGRAATPTCNFSMMFL